MPFQDEGEYDDWTADERMREWGDEYAAQNSLLYSLVGIGVLGW
jgi:hypothetical protein